MGINDSANILENAFFLEEDQKLIQKLKELREMQESKENLRKVSGITNEKILEKLASLKITPQMLAALTVVPLIEVAWSDGNVDENEKKAVLSQVEKHGIKKGSTEHELIDLWLIHKPEEKLFTAWTHLVEDICQKMSGDEMKNFKESLMHDTRAVASASGGFLGFGKISKEEKTMIEKLEQAFHQ